MQIALPQSEVDKLGMINLLSWSWDRSSLLNIMVPGCSRVDTRQSFFSRSVTGFGLGYQLRWMIGLSSPAKNMHRTDVLSLRPPTASIWQIYCAKSILLSQAKIHDFHTSLGLKS